MQFSKALSPHLAAFGLCFNQWKFLSIMGFVNNCLLLLTIDGDILDLALLWIRLRNKTLGFTEWLIVNKDNSNELLNRKVLG